MRYGLPLAYFNSCKIEFRFNIEDHISNLSRNMNHFVLFSDINNVSQNSDTVYKETCFTTDFIIKKILFYQRIIGQKTQTFDTCGYFSCFMLFSFIGEVKPNGSP